ncbi:DUF4216 domain-containing protein [Abeliophyllum distichum]|uniref:DUF4216 domain-containing protein n=1 Tax=Abeliophyllum distichum TaxID=126358 RepID=A0ABD1PCS5_9LAMI
MSLEYIMWPVVVTVYNLPPWLCMKPEYFMLTLLIPDPKASKCDGETMVTENNVTSIDISAEAFNDDQFILASQAHQVFYIKDPSRGRNWREVQIVHHRSLWDIVGSNIIEIDLVHNNYSFDLSLIVDLGNIEYISLHRDDGEADEIETSFIRRSSSNTVGDTSVY